MILRLVLHGLPQLPLHHPDVRTDGDGREVDVTDGTIRALDAAIVTNALIFRSVDKHWPTLNSV